MSIYNRPFGTLFVVLTMAQAFAQAAFSEELKVRQTLETTAAFCGDPGGMLFHTAFHGGITTRYLLLKAALHSQPLAQYLQLDEQQQVRVGKLTPIKVKFERRIQAADPNAQPDEMAVDPKYFDFLKVDQLNKLDALAFYFDGYAALTRQSVADRLCLSDATREELKRTISRYREDLFLPRSWWEFAARLPKDIKYRDCEFAGRFCTLVNFKVIDILTEKERDRLAEFIRTNLPPQEVRMAVESLAPLPEGISALRRYTDEDDAAPTNEK